MFNKFLRFLPPIAWMGLIFWFSAQESLPSPVIVWWDFILKKSAHVFVFGVLFYWWFKAISIGTPLKHALKHNSKQVILSFLLAFIYAFVDEFHQSFTPGRHPQLYDVAFDTSGILIAYLVMRYKNRHQLFKFNKSR